MKYLDNLKMCAHHVALITQQTLILTLLACEAIKLWSSKYIKTFDIMVGSILIM